MFLLQFSIPNESIYIYIYIYIYNTMILSEPDKLDSDFHPSEVGKKMSNN